MTADWHAALDAIVPEADAGAVGYWGLSMGTVYGLPLASGEPRIEAAVLGLMGIDGLVGFTGPPALRARITDAVGRITCPVFFIQQLDDELVPRDSALALFDALASTDKRLHANAGKHVEVPVEEIDAGLEFLACYLDGDTLPRHTAFAAPPPGRRRNFMTPGVRRFVLLAIAPRGVLVRPARTCRPRGRWSRPPSTS